MKQQRRRIYAVAAILVVLAGVSLWWNRIYQNPNRVFWDMMANNLSTNGVTRTVIQKGQGVIVSQYTQISLGQHPTAHALTVFNTNSNNLATEEISDKTHDFVRYQRITIPGKKLSTKAILGKWAELQTGQTQGLQVTSGLFDQSLLDVLPFANLSSSRRGALLRTMHQQDVFTYDAGTVKKTTLNGRQVYLYAVNIKPSAYIRLMQQVEKLIGGTSYSSLKPSGAAKAKPIAVVISVDARSHTLSQLYETGAQRTVSYSGFGVTDTTGLPKATITTTELTKRLGQVLQH